MKTPWFSLWLSISTTFASHVKATSFILHWNETRAAQRVVQKRQEWATQKQFLLQCNWLFPKANTDHHQHPKQQLPNTTSSCSKNLYLMNFRQVKNSPVNRRPNAALCIAAYLGSVMPKMVWAPLKALLPHGYSASLFSTNRAHTADFIIAGVIMMHVFHIWLPILSTRSGIHYFWDNYLCNICFKLVMGSKVFQDRRGTRRQNRQSMIAEAFFL